jgi:hypothetical protein
MSDPLWINLSGFAQHLFSGTTPYGDRSSRLSPVLDSFRKRCEL